MMSVRFRPWSRCWVMATTVTLFGTVEGEVECFLQSAALALRLALEGTTK